MALPNGLPQVSDLGSLLGSLGSDLVSIPLMTPTTGTGTPAAGLFHSSISKRASMYDLRKDLGAKWLGDRLVVQQIYQIPDEFGSGGEPVWGAVNDPYGQLRFVGNWTVQQNTNGQFVQTTTADNYVEITFYGTGLNVMTFPSDNTKDSRASVDGGAEAANFYGGVTESNILLTRNYSPNVVRNVVNGLTLDVHTVKIRHAANNLQIHGFEVINTNASIKVNVGTMWKNGQKIYNSSQNTLTYNSGFESGTLGTRGGRVITYIKPDGTIAKAVQPTDTTPKGLGFSGTNSNGTWTGGQADHSNEEVARIYHYREFGAGRADCFATLTNTPTRSGNLTLDDGSTTLTGTNQAVFYYGQGDGLSANGSPSELIFTFVGTGLDIVNVRNAAHASAYTIYVDSVAILSGSTTIGGTGQNNTIKIVSGLPYGTHTVRISVPSISGPICAWSKFIVYQPKTPTVPSNSGLICSYNIMADYVASSAATVLSVASGVLRKMGCRENTYVGSWTIGTPDITFNSGQNITCTAVGNYVEHTFTGTGIEWSGFFGANPTNITVSIDGSTNLSGFTTSLSQPGTGVTFTAATGVLSGTSSAVGNMRARVTGLSLGTHKIRVTLNASGGNQVYADCFDVVTPIHSYKDNTPFTVQNTLTVGSQGLSDGRKLASEAFSQTKNISKATKVSADPTTTATTAYPMVDMSVTHRSKTGKIKINLDIQSSHNTTGGISRFEVAVNGSFIGLTKNNVFQAGGAGTTVTTSDSITVQVGIGVHKIDVYWYTNTGTHYQISGASRTMSVEDV